MQSNRAAIEKGQLLEQVEKIAKRRLKSKDRSEFLSFLKVFYDPLAPRDIRTMSSDNLYGAALAAWKFIAQRKPAQQIVRVFNPRVDKHGWKSSHTVIEILNDDMPFLFDSVTGFLNFHGYTLHITIHPVIRVRRNAKGGRIALITESTSKTWAKDEVRESYIHLQINEQTDPARLRQITNQISELFSDIRAAVEDWQKMMVRAGDVIGELQTAKAGVEEEEVEETAALLRWLREDHFTFLGCADYAYHKIRGKDLFRAEKGSGLGIMRDPDRMMLSSPRSGELAPIAQHFLQRPELTLITKTGIRGRIHRQVHMDYIAIKRYDKKGKLLGERRFVGLFTSSAYNQRARDIPILRRKLAGVMNRAGYDPVSHDGKALVHILESFPRDEIFQVDEATLSNFAHGILAIQDRAVIRMFVRRDPFDRFYSCIIYVPRERLSTQLRKAFEAILMDAFKGRLSNYYTQVSDSVLARLHVIIGLNPGEPPAEVDYEQVETRLIQAARTWQDDLRDALIESRGEETGNRLSAKYLNGFPTAYCENFNTQLALIDIDHLETLHEDGEVALNFYRRLEDDESSIRFKLFSKGGAIALSDCMPMLENMGMKVIEESPYIIRFDGAEPVWLHDFYMINRAGSDMDSADLKGKLEAVFEKIWRNEVEDDGFNRLVAGAGLGWREVVILRAYCKYLRQAAIPYSQAYMEDTLAAHPNIARLLAALFLARFDPKAKRGRDKIVAGIERDIEAALDDVTSLDEDRIIRRYLNLIQVTLRTNYFQPDETGATKPYISFKLDSQKVEDLPLPRPLQEIFVYSARVEGVHLRGGMVARGGLRWSDRREDFRTEVLGLMKAQMVKNAVIVPVGSKGGFVPKRLPPPGNRDAFMAEGIECYKVFIRGLLDITDNFAGTKVLPPRDVLRLDGDDPYLVVAADKGTATFSDIANGLAIDYGFWLGDAFASGGAKGYDHKGMGITARGAWESVKRHFREMGRDIQKEPFSVVGIGDMSGDVFGNGMLLSKQIKLLVAFDHRDIFFDPDPDPAASWTERKRLFDTPGTTWRDYDKKLISKGGGVFSRSLKSIPLNAALKALSGLDVDEVAPLDLLHAVLKSDVDLLWFGGIGTYVKSSAESHAAAGDRANDSLRVDGRDLRAKVIGEGGNLGMTQLGRIEYAMAGGRLNTDAIDNSAGVDCSDHEVNIKILLDAVVADGEMTGKQRDRQLAAMTDEVGLLVLRDNYLQTQIMSVTENVGAMMMERHARYMRALEKAGDLDRSIEFLPDDEAIAERLAAGQGLTRPELSVLLSYAKNVLYGQLLESDIGESDALVQDLVKYFPRPLRKKYRRQILNHRLRREIIATIAANSMVNRLGLTFVPEIMEQTGESAGEVGRAYSAMREAFGFKAIWGAMETLDNKVPTAIQTEMTLACVRLHRTATLWALNNVPGPRKVSAMIDAFGPGVKFLQDNLKDLLGAVDAADFAAKTKEYISRGVPKPLARQVAGLTLLSSALDIVSVSNETGRDVSAVAGVYFSLGTELGFDWLHHQARGVPSGDHWEDSALVATVEDLFAHQRAATSMILSGGRRANGEMLLRNWLQKRAVMVDRNALFMDDLKSQAGMDIAKLSLASHSIGRLLRT